MLLGKIEYLIFQEAVKGTCKPDPIISLGKGESKMKDLEEIGEKQKQNKRKNQQEMWRKEKAESR